MERDPAIQVFKEIVDILIPIVIVDLMILNPKHYTFGRIFQWSHFGMMARCF